MVNNVILKYKTTPELKKLLDGNNATGVKKEIVIMRLIEEPARNIPITHEADLVVAGGGTAGVACAVCAARAGLSVIMIENAIQPGGMVTHVTQWTGDFGNKGGFAYEFFITWNPIIF